MIAPGFGYAGVGGGSHPFIIPDSAARASAQSHPIIMPGLDRPSSGFAYGSGASAWAPLRPGMPRIETGPEGLNETFTIPTRRFLRRSHPHLRPRETLRLRLFGSARIPRIAWTSEQG
jgi:hypothetical protein